MSCSAAVATHDPHDTPASASESELATFFDVSLDLLVIRELDGRVIRVSRSWEAALGYSPEEMRGALLMPLVHPDDLAATLNSVHIARYPDTKPSVER